MRWEDGRVVILDQTALPRERAFLHIGDVRELAEAIKSMKVRGAPAIGIAAAYGVAQAACTGKDARKSGLEACELLSSTRPTAVNLFWALERMRRLILSWEGEGERLGELLLREAEAIAHEQDLADRRIGELGASLLTKACKILTHCNAGGLATLSYGTALGVIKTAHAQGKVERVWVDETRPLLQGARLTAWELEEEGIPYTVICDSMAGFAMARGEVDAVVVGADRIAANGDIANKIGTYALAVLARHHGVPLYVAAPLSSLDLSLPSGEKIPIEERPAREVREWGGTVTTPEGAGVWNPAFDLTPASLIEAIVTEGGIARPPYKESLARCAGEVDAR